MVLRQRVAAISRPQRLELRAALVEALGAQEERAPLQAWIGQQRLRRNAELGGRRSAKPLRQPRKDRVLLGGIAAGAQRAGGRVQGRTSAQQISGSQAVVAPRASCHGLAEIHRAGDEVARLQVRLAQPEARRLRPRISGIPAREFLPGSLRTREIRQLIAQQPGAETRVRRAAVVGIARRQIEVGGCGIGALTGTLQQLSSAPQRFDGAGMVG